MEAGSTNPGIPEPNWKPETNLSFLHLLESEGPLLDVAGDLDELDSAEAADAECSDDTNITQLNVGKRIADPARKIIYQINSFPKFCNLRKLRQ